MDRTPTINRVTADVLRSDRFNGWSLYVNGEIVLEHESFEVVNAVANLYRSAVPEELGVR